MLDTRASRSFPTDHERAVETDFSLERAEISMLLTMRQHDGDDFSSALDFALAASGNACLFELPTEAFPQAAHRVAAIRIRTDHASGVAYVYHCAESGDFLIADALELDDVLLDLAAHYAELTDALNAETTH